MKSLRYFTCTSVVALLLSAGAVRAADESPYKFEFHGFVTGSLYMQNQTFGTGSGQGLLFFAPAPAAAAPCKTIACQGGTFTAGQATKSGTFLGGDVRQSRFVFALSGPKAFAGATPKAYFEGDLLGGSPGGVLYESWLWRIRAAFAELKWTNFVFQAGQHSAQLAFAQLPDSVSHIANPYTFGAGSFGWRTMGIRGFYTVPMGDMKFELAGSIAQPTWGNASVPGATPATINSGMATNIPQLEARARIEGKSGPLAFNIYADGLYQSADLKNFGTTAPNGVTLADGSTKTSATIFAGELGGKIGFSPAWVAFNVYTGQGLGSMAGALLQMGEIQELGYWVGVGANLSKEFSLSAHFGQSLPDKKDVYNWAPAFANTNPKKDNTMYAGQLKYMDAGYAFAVEYIGLKTTYLTGTLNAQGPTIKTDGYQLIASAGYFF